MGRAVKPKPTKRVARVRVITKKKLLKQRLPKKAKLSRSNKRMAVRTAQKKTSMKKSTARKMPVKTSVRAKAPKSFLHKMLTAEGWKRLMMGKSNKK